MEYNKNCICNKCVEKNKYKFGGKDNCHNKHHHRCPKHKKGKTGPTGPTGQDGIQGETGPTGISMPGFTGSTGPTGQDGFRGETGPTGISMPGFTGSTGPTGNDSNVAGPTGPTGTLEFFDSDADTTFCPTYSINILEPISADNNVGIVIHTRGTGPLMVDTPSNISAGGNCRGDYAVDLQSQRSVLTSVASGNNSVITGGDNNRASGLQSTVGGGSNNTASGGCSTVSGGKNNMASGIRATVSGGGGDLVGNGNVASGGASTVSGGFNSVALGIAASVGGGSDNTAMGSASTISGGFNNNTISDYSTVSGGLYNDADGENSVVSGGNSNIASGVNSTVSGGENNIASGINSGIGNGLDNEVTADHSFAVGKYNKPGLFDYSNAVPVPPGPPADSERIFMVGYGDSDIDRFNLFSVTADGNAHIQGSLYTGGFADFAEYFETVSQESLPLGTAVMFEHNSKKILPSDNPLNTFGVISNTGAFIGNACSEGWSGKYEKDSHGNVAWETVTKEKLVTITEKITKERITRETDYTVDPPRIIKKKSTHTIECPVMIEAIEYDEEGNETGKHKVPKKKLITTEIKKKKISASYDPKIKYIPRLSRPEWNIVGLVGMVKVLKDQPLKSSWKIVEYGDVYNTVFIS